MATPRSLPNVTVVVPVKNEERNIGRCLSALTRFPEIVVVDSSSTDRTREIAEDLGAKVVQFVWNGKYPKKRNWLLLNYEFKTEWVLFIDADEVVDDRFCDEVLQLLSDSEHAGYWINYTNVFLNRELKFGVAQRKLALFRIGSGLYEKIDEDTWSGLDMEIHEHPIVRGSVGEVATPVEHRDYKNISAFLSRHVEYARWESNRYLQLEAKMLRQAEQFTLRQRLKYGSIEKWWFPSIYFLYAYVVRGGFLDGGAGYHYAVFKFWYFSVIRLMILEAKENKQRSSP